MAEEKKKKEKTTKVKKEEREKTKTKKTKKIVKKKRAIKKFTDLKPEEVKKIILDLHNKGKTKSEIGLILRDQHGVPKVKEILKKSIGDVLKEANIKEDIPEDLMSLIRKNVALKNHLQENKKDYTAKRGYELSLSKIRRLVRYYKRKGKLPEKWTYTDEIGALLVK